MSSRVVTGVLVSREIGLSTVAVITNLRANFHCQHACMSYLVTCFIAYCLLCYHFYYSNFTTSYYHYYASLSRFYAHLFPSNSKARW